MKVGDIVIPDRGTAISSDSVVYGLAVVVSMDPFVIVSENGEMLWSWVLKTSFRSIGSANNEVLSKVTAKWNNCRKSMNVNKDEDSDTYHVQTRPETSTIDELFLELSQFTRATTEKEIRLERQIENMAKEILDREESRTFLGKPPGYWADMQNYAMKNKWEWEKEE